MANLHASGTGAMYKGGGDPAALDKAMRQALATRSHLYICTAAYILTAQEAARTQEGVTLLLDEAHLAVVAGPGCYVCEQEYAQCGPTCPGQPYTYTKDGRPVYRRRQRG